MEPWKVRPYVEDQIKKQGTYDRYCDLCLRLEAPPLSQSEFVDRYVDIIQHSEILYQQAVDLLPGDKNKFLEALEKSNAPVEDIVMVDMLPPSLSFPLNKLPKGMICLFILFPGDPHKPMIMLSYVGAGNEETVFL